MSGAKSSSQASTFGSRALIEFTFQVAILTARPTPLLRAVIQ